jgi:hypothetical protein
MRFAGRGDYAKCGGMFRWLIGKSPTATIQFSILIAALAFAIMKVVLINFDFFYTTYKSVTIRKNMEHAFNPGFTYRLKRGLVGDICYFIAGIVVAVNADAIRGFFST